MPEKLFVYGTLKEESVQREALGRKVQALEPDELKGFAKAQISIDGYLYPVISPSAKQSVKGFVFDVSRDDLKKLDEYEGPAYKREKVTLVSGAKAWVYSRAQELEALR